MYAILELGGKQYKVSPDDVIEVNLLKQQKGETIKLENVLLYADGKKVDIGQPYVKGAIVEAEVLDQTKGKKVCIFKYRRRQDSHKKTGHRQKLTKLLIKNVTMS